MSTAKTTTPVLPTPTPTATTEAPRDPVALAEMWLLDQTNQVLKRELLKALDRTGPLTVYLDNDDKTRRRGFMISTRSFKTNEYIRAEGSKSTAIIPRVFAAPPKGEIAVVPVPRTAQPGEPDPAIPPPLSAADVLS